MFTALPVKWGSAGAILRVFVCVLLITLIIPSGGILASSEDQIVTYGRTRYYNASGQEVTNNPVLGSSAVVSVDKSIAPTQNDNEFDMTLTVKTSLDIKEVQVSSDVAVVLVLDVSPSMFGMNEAEVNHMPALRTAAKAFLDALAGEANGSLRYVSLVAFGGDATIRTGWRDITNYANLVNMKTSIDNLTQVSATCIEGGLQLARNLLRLESLPNGRDGLPIVNRNVILFSDGGANTVSNTTTGATAASYEQGTTILGRNLASYSGEPTSMAQAASMANEVKFADSFNTGSTYQKHRAYLYTVAFGSEAPASWLSSNIATNASYAYTASNASQLNNAFAAIARRIESWAEAWVVTDPMGPNIDFISTISAADIRDGRVLFEDNTLVWDLKKTAEDSFINDTYTYTYQYRIRLDVARPGFVPETPYPTNGRTTLSYVMIEDDIIVSDVFTADFAIPTVKGYHPRDVLSKKSVTDADGDGLASPGEMLTYTIEIKNNGLSPVLDELVQDSMDGINGLMNHINNPDVNVVTINNNGTTTLSTVGALRDGIVIPSIAPGATVTLSFSVQVRSNLNTNSVKWIWNESTHGNVGIPTRNVTSGKSVTDADGDGQASPGETLTYTIVIINYSEASLVNELIRDPLTDLIAHIDNPDANEVVINNNGTITRTTVAALREGIRLDILSGAMATIRFDLKIRDDLNVNVVKMIRNVSTHGDVEIHVRDLQSVKSVVDANGDGLAAPGEELTYTITLFNNGTGVVENEVIRDTLAYLLPYIDNPANSTVTIRNTSPVQNYLSTIANLRNGITVARINPKATVTLSFTVRVRSDLDVSAVEGKELYNISSHGENYIPLRDVDSTKSVSDSDGDGAASPGEALSYTITIVNNSNVALKNELVHDPLDQLLPYVDDPTYNTVRVTNNSGMPYPPVSFYTVGILSGDGILIQEIAPGATVELSFSLRVKADLDVDAVKEIHNISTHGEIVIPTRNLAIEKIVEDENEDGSASPGETLTYTITLRNKGLGKLENEVVRDTLEELFSAIDNANANTVSIVNGGVSSQSTVLALRNGITIPEIAAGATVTLRFTVKVRSDLNVNQTPVLKNTATVGNQEATVEIPTGKQEVSATKSAVDASGDGFASPGELITYTIRAINSGNLPAVNVFVQDTLSGVLPYVDSALSAVVTIDNGGVTTTATVQNLINGITIPQIAANTTASLSFSLRVKSDLDVEVVRSIYNEATVDDRRTEVEICTLDLFKDTDALKVSGNGDIIQYTISFRMPDNIADYESVLVMDRVPDTLRYLGGGKFFVDNVEVPFANTGVFGFGDDVSWQLSGSSFSSAAGKMVSVQMSFEVGNWTGGSIVNTAELYFKPRGGDYPTEPGIKREKEIGEAELKKDADIGMYTPGDDLGYTISAVLPEDVADYAKIELIDDYEANNLLYKAGSAIVTIDGAPLTAQTQYTLTDQINGDSGRLTVTILNSAYPFTNLAGKTLTLKLSFTVDYEARGIIKNVGSIEYDDRFGGQDEEEVELAIGPPTQVDETSGDRKVALLWADPLDAEAIRYQIKVDDGAWVTYEKSDLTFDAERGLWYLLFRGLVNERTYTFQIRAVNTLGLAGAAFAIDATPRSLGDIGGDNADLVSIHGVTLLPADGWPIDLDTGVGFSTTRPYEVTMKLDTTFNHATVLLDRIVLGTDARAVMYGHYDWRDSVTGVDRLDVDQEWKEEVHVYLIVTSGNGEQMRYYDVAIQIPGRGGLGIGPFAEPDEVSPENPALPEEAEAGGEESLTANEALPAEDMDLAGDESVVDTAAITEAADTSTEEAAESSVESGSDIEAEAATETETETEETDQEVEPIQNADRSDKA